MIQAAGKRQTHKRKIFQLSNLFTIISQKFVPTSIKVPRLMKTSYIENRRDIIFHVMPFINLIKKLLYECVLEYLLRLILVIPRLFYQSHASDISSVCMLRVKDMSNEVCNFKLVELAIVLP